MGELVLIYKGRRLKACKKCKEMPALEDNSVCRDCEWEGRFTKAVYDHTENNRMFKDEN